MADVPAFLRTVSLFQDLDGSTLGTLSSLLVPKRIRAGEIVFRELDASDALYVVERGSVVVSKHVHNEVDIVLTRFQPGDFFGEMGLFDEAPRSATAQADVESHLWMLKRAAFNEILTKLPPHIKAWLETRWECRDAEGEIPVGGRGKLPPRILLKAINAWEHGDDYAPGGAAFYDI